MGRGRPIDQGKWPDDRPRRTFLELLDKIHREHGTPSRSHIAERMHLSARSRVANLLNGAPPVDEVQTEDLIRALGGSDQDVDRGLRLYRLIKPSETDASRSTVSGRTSGRQQTVKAVRDSDETAVSWRKAIDASPLLQCCADAGLVHAVVSECAQRFDDATETLLAQTGLADPWTDKNYPVRVLRNAELLLRHANILPRSDEQRPSTGKISAEIPEQQSSGPLPPDITGLGPGEAALLITAPFLREAVLAKGLRDAAGISPVNFDRTFTPGARADLELTHEMHRHLIQRAVGLRERVDAGSGSAGTEPDGRCTATANARGAGRSVASASDALALWLVHRWLAGRVRLWEEPDALKICNLGVPVIGDCQGSALGEEELLVHVILRGIAAEPANTRLLSKLKKDYVDDRWRFVAAVLWLAGIMAADPRRLPPVVADLVGTKMELPLSTVQDAAERLASWHWNTRSRTLNLHLTCDHPALHDAFEEITHRAEEARKAIETTLGLPPAMLAQLPRRFASKGLRPRTVRNGDGEEAAYNTPLSRFRVAEEKVRELLMGQQLYDDRKLAIRELYQNALDACRWRAIRERYLIGKGLGIQDERDDVSWTGLIRFTQGTDNGRPFIECEDNGVGMDLNTLKHVFANAGERFVYDQEFRDEQADWADLDPPLRLVPNSQFGIGVFSYFMLADEIVVTTRHQARNGIPDPHAHEVYIASSGSLLQIKPAGGILRECGTRVRLYLNGDAEGVSALKAVRDFLWIAEHRVEITEGQDHEIWEAGELRLEYGVTEPLKCGRDFWWVPGQGGLAADGINVSDKTGGPGLTGLIVNLHDEHRPQFTLDRSKLLDWDKDRVSRLARESVPALTGWPGLTLNWIWGVAINDVALAQQVFEHAVATEQSIPVENHSFDTSPVSLNSAGCLAWDTELITRSTESAYAPWLRAWRVGVWRDHGVSPGNLPDICVPQATQGFPIPEPIDQPIFGELRTRQTYLETKPWPEDVVWPQDYMPMLWALRGTGLTVRAQLRRLRKYAIIGLNLSWARPVAPTDATISEFNSSLFAVLEGWSPPGEPARRSFQRSWLRSSELMDMPPGEVLRRARVLARDDWTAPEIEFGEFADRPLTKDERTLLACAKWDDGTYGKLEPPSLIWENVGLFYASALPSMSLGEVLDLCDRLAPLGIAVPYRDSYPRELNAFEKKAFRYIRTAGQTLSQLNLVEIARAAGVTVGQAHHALARLEQQGLLTRPELSGSPDFRPTPRDMDLLETLISEHGLGGDRVHVAPALRIAEIITRQRTRDRAYIPAARNLAPFTAPARFTAPEIVAAAHWFGTTLAGASRALRDIYPDAKLPLLTAECAELTVSEETCGALLDLREEVTWRLGPGPIVNGSLAARKSLGDFLEMLDPFKAMGAEIPPFDKAIRDKLNRVELDKYDENMLTVPDETGRKTYLRSVTPLDLVRIAGRLGWTPIHTHRRLSRLVPVGLVLEYPCDDLPNEIARWQDLLVLTTYFDGQPPALYGRVDQSHLNAASAEIFDAATREEIAKNTAWLRTRLALYAALFQLELST